MFVEQEKSLNISKNVIPVYYLGIDGGGTKTQYLLCDEKNNVVKEIVGKGSNPFDIGIEEATEILDSGIREVLGDIPCNLVQTFAGIAGSKLSNNQDQLYRFFHSFGFKKFDFGSDNENIISAGLQGRDGITLIMGTGICLFKVVNGERRQLSGWGYLIDEGGSGYNYGLDAIKAYYEYIDGFREGNILFEKLQAQSGLEPKEFLNKIYSEGKKYVASFAPLVFECAEKYNDCLSKTIIDRNTAVVGKLIDKALEDFPDGKNPVECVITGGVSKQSKITEYLYKHITNKDGVHIRVLDVSPVVGAVRKAREL